MPALRLTKNPGKVANDVVKTLSDILVDQGAMTAEAAQKIKFTEVQTGKPQEEIIKLQNLVDEANLTKAKATLYNVAFDFGSRCPGSSLRNYTGYCYPI